MAAAVVGREQGVRHGRAHSEPHEERERLAQPARPGEQREQTWFGLGLGLGLGLG